MFKLFGLVVKITIFSIVVLVLANWFEWRGKTISDQVKIQVSHAERSKWMGTVKDVTLKVKETAEEQLKHSPIHLGATKPHKSGQPRTNYQENPSANSSDGEKISASEKQKLKALIHELNSTHSENN